jgi:hypothetical protein
MPVSGIFLAVFVVFVVFVVLVGLLFLQPGRTTSAARITDAETAAINLCLRLVIAFPLIHPSIIRTPGHMPAVMHDR